MSKNSRNHVTKNLTSARRVFIVLSVSFINLVAVFSLANWWPDLTTQPANAQAAQIGYFDGATCESLRGWTGVPGEPNRSIAVDFYAGPAENGLLIGSAQANQPREAAVCEALGGENCDVCPSNDPQCLHGFDIVPPSILKNGAPFQVYAYSLDPETGLNVHLNTSPKPVYCEAQGTLDFTESWQSSVSRNSTRSTTGDVDNDGDLDLIIGSTRTTTHTLQLYINQGDGQLVPNWFSPHQDRITSAALADMDGDGDLDLAVGVINVDDPGLAQNRIYINNGVAEEGTILYESFWESPHSDQTFDVEWGDVDNDGDPDLAVANAGIKEYDFFSIELPTGNVNRVYRNNHDGPEDMPAFESVWTSGHSKFSTSIAWGDFNNDNYPDLVVGNAKADINRSGCLRNECDIRVEDHNHIYFNDGTGNLLQTPGWTSDEAEGTTSITILDINDDGFLDLAVGNANVFPRDNFDTSDIDKVRPAGHPNRIYLNLEGELETTASWSSAENDATAEITSGDFDNDGDPDLIVGNLSSFDSRGENITPGSPNNRIYRNNGGVFSPFATWSFPQQEDTIGILFADMDNDSDLDVVASNGNLRRGEPDQIIRNDHSFLSRQPTWLSSESETTWSIAWGDVDNDNDLDLIVGNGGEDEAASNQLYKNEDGILVLSDWSPAPDKTTSVAFGDVDGDFDLDLIVGNYEEANRLYLNENGEFILDETWSTETGQTSAVAWGDMNGDGPIDLVVASKNGPTRIYLNRGTSLEEDANWASPMDDSAFTLALADIDRDGDLDFIVASKLLSEPTRLYQNNSNPVKSIIQFDNIWETQPSETHDVRALALGDVNKDGYVDLVVGNFSRPLYLYMNKDGVFENRYSWSSQRANQSHALQWGDFDGDGDIDLFEGNDQQANALYISENGALAKNRLPLWTSAELDNTRSVGWADIDLDGDLDILAGNFENKLRLYQNPRRSQTIKGDSPPFASIEKPGESGAAPFFSSSEILGGPTISVTYTLFDAESETVERIIPEYSLDGGQSWQPATPAAGEGVTNLVTAPWPMGVEHLFRWDVFSDLIKNDNVTFRILVQPEVRSSPILWGSQGSTSLPFRVEAPGYVQVVDQNGSPVAGTALYSNGNKVTNTKNGATLTDFAGRINPTDLQVGDSLVVLAEMDHLLSGRQCESIHGERSIYRTTVTNVTWNENEPPLFETVTADSIQRLTLNPESPLVLFDIIVSVEWDAGKAYIDDIALAMENASNYLYDATDGQMAFGTVKIYNNKECWNAADFRISAANDIIPHAATGQIGNPDPNASIRLGRGWDRNAKASPWSKSDGYRTMIHEFAHYAFGVYDEYIGHKLNEAGDVTGIAKGYCIGPEIEKDQDNDTTNASIMYWQYTATEFSAQGNDKLWNADWCTDTIQYQENGQSVWETIDEVYSDKQESNPRWQIVTPAERGALMIGPAEMSAMLPSLPKVEKISESDLEDQPTLLLTIVDNETNLPLPGVNVTMITPNGVTLKQGATNRTGEIEIVGARLDAVIKALTIDGGFQGELSVKKFGSTRLQLTPVNN